MRVGSFRARAFGGFLAAASSSAIACGGGSTEGLVCAAAGACGAGQAWVVAHCRPSDAIVTPSDTNRILLQPVDVAVLASGRTEASPPDAIVLGAEANGATVVLLRFEATWRDDAEVTSA